MQYNEIQEKAVAHTKGPMLVLAGPGSGKTAVITGRCARLIRDGISPSSILVVTFTKAAASEMKERFLKLTGGKARGATFGTFHGIYYGILKNTYRIRGGCIMADDLRQNVLREILLSVYPGAAQEADLPSQVGREISLVKGSRADVRHFYSGVLPQDVFRSVYTAYENWKRDNGRMDFDDIITRCHALLSGSPEILQRWQEKFRYILVDEFQDISPLQYEILRMLALPENNLFIVGDDDQSIYRFRGASPELMLNFPKDYPDAQILALEDNYRNTPQILGAAGRLITHNRKRYEKLQIPVSEDGEKVAAYMAKNSREECRRVAEDILRAHEEGVPYEEMALLFRTNGGCREAVEQLMEYRIPFQAGDAIPCVFDHWIAKNIFCYMDIGAGSRARSDFLQICNRPNRYLSRDAFYEPVVSFEHLYAWYEGKDWMERRVEQFESQLRMVGRLSPYGAVTYIRREIGYEEYLKSYAMERNLPAEDLLSVLDELADSARNYRTYQEWQQAISAFRETLQEQKMRSPKDKKEGVMVSTLHASKGMEYDRVWILDVNEGIIPYHKAVLDADLEEERRMLYVGMTRARKKLTLCSVRERYEKAASPSPFLEEIFG